MDNKLSGNKGVAFILSFIPGVGHMYMERFGEGISLMIIGIIMLFIYPPWGVLIGIGNSVYNMYKFLHGIKRLW